MPDFQITDVDTMRITNTANSIDDDIKELNAIQTEIKNSILPMLNQCWQGQAKQKFESQIALYLMGFSKTIDEYNQLNGQLKKAGETYNNADSSVKQLIAKLPK